MSDYCSPGVEFYPEAEQGWQCPECKTIYSPSVMLCPCCAVVKFVPGNTDWPYPGSDPATNPPDTGDPILPAPYTVIFDSAGNSIKELRKRVEDVDDGR